MSDTPSKYQGYLTGETGVAGGATATLSMGQFLAEDDVTIVSAMVDIAVSNEFTAETAGFHNLLGIARLVVAKSGQSLPTLVEDIDWDDTGVADTLNDDSQGDCWAATTFALPNVTHTRCELRPRTARKLRKGDTLLLIVQTTNRGASSTTIGAAAFATLFVKG